MFAKLSDSFDNENMLGEEKYGKLMTKSIPNALTMSENF
jgi:hypothetical protein